MSVLGFLQVHWVDDPGEQIIVVDSRQPDMILLALAPDAMVALCAQLNERVAEALAARYEADRLADVPIDYFLERPASATGRCRARRGLYRSHRDW